jgi:hypothetical protein
VFPDARLTAGAVEASSRAVVDVQVTLSVPPVEPLPLHFQSFDVDDPSASVGPVDFSTHTDDNRGTFPALAGRFVGNPVGVVFTSTVTLQVSTAASFETTIQPGDNFRVAVAGDRDLLAALLNDDTILGAGSNADQLRIIDPAISGPFTRQEIRESTKTVTPVLTVWRQLHIERDSMGVVGVNVATGNITGYTPAGPAAGATQLNVDVTLRDGSADLDTLISDNGRFERGTMTVAGVSIFPSIDANGQFRAVRAAGFNVAAAPLPFNAVGPGLVSPPVMVGTITGISSAGGTFTLTVSPAPPGGGAAFAGGLIQMAGGPPVGITGGAAGTLTTGALGIPFSLTDDDQLTGDVPEPDTTGMAVVWDKAYVLPLFDTAQDSPSVAFQRNVESPNQTAAIGASRGSPAGTAACWIVPVLNVFQIETGTPGNSGDNDPDGEGTARAWAWTGVTGAGNSHGVIFGVENIQDWIRTAAPNGPGGVDPAPGAGRQRRLQEILNHEVGHNFGLQHGHGTPANALDPLGDVMLPSCCPPDTAGSTRGRSPFGAQSLHLIRSETLVGN